MVIDDDDDDFYSAFPHHLGRVRALHKNNITARGTRSSVVEPRK